MKASDIERKRFDKALDEIIDLFNNLENDEPIISFSAEVVDNIERAKKKYGEKMISERINTVVGEMLSWLDLDGIDDNDEDSDEEGEDSIEEEE
jgi:hypothetical protein